MTGIYGSGLGDQDVLLLDNPDPTDDGNYTSPPTRTMGKAGAGAGSGAGSVFKLSKLSTSEAILEGDEEDEGEGEVPTGKGQGQGQGHGQGQEQGQGQAELEAAADEWDRLDAGSFSSPAPALPSPSAPSSSVPLSSRKAALAPMPPSYFVTEMPNAHFSLHNLAFQHLCELDLTAYRPLIQVTDDLTTRQSVLMTPFVCLSISLGPRRPVLSVPVVLAGSGQLLGRQQAPQLHQLRATS